MTFLYSYLTLLFVFRSSDNSDTVTEMMNVMKSYEQGFRLTAKTKVGASSALSTKGVHPAFQDSDDDMPDRPALSFLKIKKPIEIEKNITEVTTSKELSSDESTISKKCSQGSVSQSYEETVSKDHSTRSHSKGHSKSRSRSLSRSHSRSHSKSSSRRRSKSRSRERFRSYSRSVSRERSRSPYMRRTRSRSRSQPRSNYRSRRRGGRPRARGRIHSYQRPRSRDRDEHYHDGFRRFTPYHNPPNSSHHYPNRFRGHGRFGGRRGRAPFKGNRGGHWEKKKRHRSRDSPEPLSEQEREMMVQTARKKLEESIKYGAVDPDIWESTHDKFSFSKTPSRSDFSCTKSPRSESSHPKTPSRWESSRPKTPSRWESSRPKTPNRWESSRPKTPSRWESSLPKTPSRWNSSRPKTPSRWDTFHPKTPNRWESSHPKTPSRLDSSRPKTPSRWESSRSKTPSKGESSRLKTPSTCDSSHPKTPSHRSSKESKEENCNDYNENSPHASSENSPDRSARFGKWDNDEKGRNGDSKIGNSLTEMETFIEVAKQKKIEEMKERNKEFLKPNVN